MGARSEYPEWPEPGSPVFGDGGSLLEDAAAHFVDRPRGMDAPPQDVRALLRGDRLASILQLGALHGFQVHNSGLNKAVCVSDISGPELEGAFCFGVNSRGAIPPWAIVLSRKKLWESGFRPVHYTEPTKVDDFRRACTSAIGEGWGALVVSTNPLDDGRNDWTHEREWRYCFAPADSNPQVDVQGMFRAVIVGEKGWIPTSTWVVPESFGSEPREGVDFTVKRWLWDADMKRLVHDGVIVVERRLRPRSSL